MEEEPFWFDMHEYPINVMRDIEVLQDILKHADADDLVVFDVDQTLITEQDLYDRLFLKDRIDAKTIEALSYRRVEGIPADIKPIDLASRASQLKKMMLVDDKLADIIMDLNNRNVPTIALTDCKTGPYGRIPSLEDWRIKMLQDLGIKFNGSFASSIDIIFKRSCERSRVPVYKRGVLFTGHACDKGTLLIAFMRAVKSSFKRVFCIDDDPEYLKSEYEALCMRMIPATLINFTAANYLPAKFDRQVAEFQLQYLITKDSWLTGEQTKDVLEGLNA
jgi:hypothetical protein